MAAGMRKRPKLTENQYDKWAEELKGWIAENVSPFEDDSPEAQAARKARGREDLLFFCATYLPHYFSLPCEVFHEEWEELSRARDEMVLVGAPREHAKSTFWSFGLPIHRACYGLEPFALILSDTRDQATGFTLPIRLEFEDNPRLVYDFGLAFGRLKKADDFVIGGMRIKARGRGDKVRGLKHRQHRPGLAVIDDAENDRNTRNPRLVGELKQWIQGAVLGSLRDGYLAVMVGNLFSPKSVISRLIDETDAAGVPLYRSRVYTAILDEGGAEERPLWPALWPMDRLARKKRSMGSRAFNAEMMNRVAEEDTPFREEWFRFAESVGVDPEGCYMAASFVDPSAKSGEKNDFKAVITAGLIRERMIFVVLHAWIRRATIGEMFAAAYAQHDAFGGVVGIEENMFHDFLHQAIHTYARGAGRYLPWRPVRHTGNKIARITGTLSYLVEHGKLLLRKHHSDQARLKEQLIYINNATVNDDGPDALEGAVSLLQKSGGSRGAKRGGRLKSRGIMKGYR